MISILITNICSSSKIHSSSLWAPSLASRTAVLSAALYCFRSVSECVRGDVKKSTLLYVVTLPHIPASRPIVIRQRRSQSKVTVLWKNVSVPSRGAPIWSMRIYSEVMSSGDHLVPPLFVDTVTHAGIRQLFPTFHFPMQKLYREYRQLVRNTLDVFPMDHRCLNRLYRRRCSPRGRDRSLDVARRVGDCSRTYVK